MKINDIEQNRRIDVSKELEIINFRMQKENQQSEGPKERTDNHWILDEKKSNEKDKKKVKNQFLSFQKAMKVLLISGQCIGLNPVSGILQKDVSKIRFNFCSWIFLYSTTLAIAQTMGAVLSLHKMVMGPLHIFGLGFITFFVTTSSTTISFMRIARKWPALMKELSNSGLNEYIDPSLTKKCNVACFTFIGVAVVEHLLTILTKLARVIDCSVGPEPDYFEEFARQTSPWLFHLGIPYNVFLAAALQFLNITTTAIWSYLSMFIVCISLYLTSVLEQINKKIAVAAEKNNTPSTIWGVLREDYTRATRLVRLFDDMFSSIILVSFACDLFFICLQLFNMLETSIKSPNSTMALRCPNSDNQIRYYEYAVYFAYSTIFIFVRFLTVSLIAAGVNTAALKPAPIIYGIPSNGYTKEVERFLNQVNGDTVALSGLQFFYITRELVLSVAGTIVTYELVLLQFNVNDKE